MTTNDMCPNCVTPWKCNGPHEMEETDSVTTKVWQQYRCRRCDVDWRAATDERIPDTCWLCEKNDLTEVKMQCGQPVQYFDPNPDGDA